MKFIHLSDLHLGKRIHGFSMLEDQKYILEQIIQIVKQEQADGVLLAGDLYDKPVPPIEAVQELDRFLTGLASLGISVFAVSGNHDSAERIALCQTSGCAPRVPAGGYSDLPGRSTGSSTAHGSRHR